MNKQALPKKDFIMEKETNRANIPREDVVCGLNPVYEVLNSGKEIDSILVSGTDRVGKAGKILSMCAERRLPVKEVSSKKLDYMCCGANHQGIVAILTQARFCSVEDILKAAADKNEAPFIVICDEIEDPHNMGAIVRTADAAGVHGIIIPKRRSAPLSFAASKAAAGALEYVPVARVSNLAQEIEKLKKQGIWVYGADMNGTDYREPDYSGGCALVVGNEGSGIGRLIKEKCDMLVSLPMKGNINSLNASVAAGILMYHISGTRK